MADSDERDIGTSLIQSVLNARAPIVCVFGQAAGWAAGDPIIPNALEKAGKTGESWKPLLDREPLDERYFDWLEERFSRRAPSAALQAIGSAPISAAFTSSIDPGLANLFSTNGRQPEPVLLGDPIPRTIRSRSRPPIFYLFGRAGPGSPAMRPPLSVQQLSLRRLQHATAMLRVLAEAATPLGLIVVDGYDPGQDWLKPDDLLTSLSASPQNGVLWCGPERKFPDDSEEMYRGLIESGVIRRDSRTLGEIFATIEASGRDLGAERWDEPEVITLGNTKVVTTPRLRLATQSAASIVDDSWTAFLDPVSDGMQQAAFHNFHSGPNNAKLTVEGVRRGFSITRDFEEELFARVERALAQHHTQRGATILHGQSGVGKSIALARLAVRVRTNASAAVLFAYGRVPQAVDVADFIEAVDKVGATTLLLVDATAAPQRYDDLLTSLRSRGHRVVVVGTSYRLEGAQANHGRSIEAPSSLGKAEQEHLEQLTAAFAPQATTQVNARRGQPNALARFYWDLPSSRARLAEGLGREARAAEADLVARGAVDVAAKDIGSLGSVLISAGFDLPTSALMDVEEVGPAGPSSDSPAGRIIDYVMAVSRLYKAVPVNLILRAVLSNSAQSQYINLETVHRLFIGQDLFRWYPVDESAESLLVGARLQIEAELVCNRRLGTPQAEADRIIDLIKLSYRAGPEDHEETKFLIDVVYALGPDGPFGERYKDSYVDIARALTHLRLSQGVINARLLLQESTLRRAYVRTHEPGLEERAAILDEASSAVGEALEAIERVGAKRLDASRRTKEHLLVERAATYGYLATDSAQRNAPPEEIWRSYKAARDAVRLAVGRVDSYFPLDIGLWLPAQILQEAGGLQELHKLELEADIRSTLDLVDPASLDASQFERFQRQRINAGAVLHDDPLGDEAFEALEAVGSTAGYYLRARLKAPLRAERADRATKAEISQSAEVSKYLLENYEKIEGDPRCLQLLLTSDWLVATGAWLFSGLRQPLPAKQDQRLRLRTVLLDLSVITGGQMQPRYRYLEAVLNWLTNDEAAARTAWRSLARETEYVESGRVQNRHTITDTGGEAIHYIGLIERQIGDDRWSVMVPSLSRHVDLIGREFSNQDIAIGRTVRDFGISFNYLGPLADPFARRSK